MTCIAGYPADAERECLGTAELFVLMVQRSWVGLNKEEGTTVYWWEGFSAVGIDRQSAAAFDIFMQILFYSSRRCLEIRERQERHLGRDEILLLRFISSVQHHQYSRALEFLEAWLEPEEAALAWEPALQMVAGLSAARLIVPLWAADVVSARRIVSQGVVNSFSVKHRWSECQALLH